MAKKSRIRPPGPDQRLTVKHWVQYLGLCTLGTAVRMLPSFLARTLGAGLGGLAYRLLGKHRDIALRNLDQAFGDTKTEEEKVQIVRNCFRHFGCALVETLRIPDIGERNFLKFVELDNVGQFYEGLKRGKGVILCSAHYGNWEIMNLTLGYLRLPMSVMARPMDNPLIHRLVERIRTQSGNKVIYKHNSVRRILSNLKENRVVGIVNDQNVQSNNRIMTPFFRRPAATTPVPAAVSIKTGAPIVTGFAVPLGKGRYRLRFEDLIWPDRNAEKDEEIQRITLLINQRLERQIHYHPSYWLWLHQRFKTGPDGPTDFYLGKRGSDHP